MMIHNEPRKILRMYYTVKELALMMDVSYNTFRQEIRRNEILHQRLTEMGWRNYSRLCKAQVLKIFEVLGYPHGYEHYEYTEKILTSRFSCENKVLVVCI